MSDDLIARLKRLHEGVTSSGVLYLRGSTVAEIIAALEERERMREVVEAARILLGDSGFLDPEYSSDMYPDEYHALSHALDALEKP